MTKIKVVTGFVPLPDNPRAGEYATLGERLFSQIDAPVTVFRNTLEECWLYCEITSRSTVTHSTGGVPEKNTMAYHCVQHQKTAWVYADMLTDPTSEVFVWIDYGVLGQPGVTVEGIQGFLERLSKDPIPTSVVIPGAWRPDWPIWERAGAINDIDPCWRFCGSVVVCPRELVCAFDRGVSNNIRDHIRDKGIISWEINTWARLEMQGTVPMQWYHSDHNESLYTGYPHV